MTTHQNELLAEDSADTPSPSATWWDRGDFLSDAEGPAGTCPVAIDVTGRARFLSYGPFADLAPGVWRATVFLNLCPDAARCRLAVQFGAEPDYTTKDLEFRITGNHKVEIEHVIHQTGPGQVRLWLKKAAFHGEVRFAGAAVERIGDIGSDENRMNDANV
jgi:hypothetical protein